MSKKVGKVSQIIGPVVDIEFPSGDLPGIYNAVIVGEGESVKIGTPYVDGTQVEAEVTRQGRADKVKIIKFRRRKHSQKKQGHRQLFTEVKITGIKTKAKTKAKAKAKAKTKTESKATVDKPEAEAEE